MYFQYQPALFLFLILLTNCMGDSGFLKFLPNRKDGGKVWIGTREKADLNVIEAIEWRSIYIDEELKTSDQFAKLPLLKDKDKLSFIFTKPEGRDDLSCSTEFSSEPLQINLNCQSLPNFKCSPRMGRSSCDADCNPTVVHGNSRLGYFNDDLINYLSIAWAFPPSTRTNTLQYQIRYAPASIDGPNNVLLSERHGQSVTVPYNSSFIQMQPFKEPIKDFIVQICAVKSKCTQPISWEREPKFRVHLQHDIDMLLKEKKVFEAHKLKLESRAEEKSEEILVDLLETTEYIETNNTGRVRGLLEVIPFLLTLSLFLNRF